jgi:hypothetical protein
MGYSKRTSQQYETSNKKHRYMYRNRRRFCFPDRGRKKNEFGKLRYSALFNRQAENSRRLSLEVRMRRLSFNPRFVDFERGDLIAGKIHSIRQNYWFWKRFEGRDVALYTWEGKPYRSKQRVFCVKRIVSVENIFLWHDKTVDGHKMPPEFFFENFFYKKKWYKAFHLSKTLLAMNDGFDDEDEFTDWFYDYPDGDVAVLHFTDFRYG